MKELTKTNTAVVERSRKYKQTEVGVIPEDWNVLALEDAVDVVGGGTPSTSVHEFWNGPINWFTPTEIGNNKFVSESNRKITEFGLKGSSAQILPIGSILLTTRASIGDMAILTNEACTNQGFQSLIPKQGYDNEFVYYSMHTKKRDLITNSSGSTFLEISPKKVKRISVPFPPTLTEQKAIATALSDVDALISSLEKLIAKKKAIKQGAMQELLTPPHKGGKRLAGFSGDPKSFGWEEKTLNDLSTNIFSGSSNTTSEVGNYPLYGSTGQIGTKKYKDYSGKRLLVARVGANAGTLYKVSGDYCVSDNTLMISVSHEIDINFLFFKLKKYNLSKLIFGSGQPLVTGGQLKGVILFIPKLEEQKAIAQILSDMDIEIAALEAKKEKYKGIKQGMMQELLTGKTRLV